MKKGILFIAIAIFSACQIMAQQSKVNWNDAISLYDENNYTAAAVAFNLIVTRTPKEKELQSLWLGKCYLSLEKYTASINQFEAIEENYIQYNIPLFLGMCHHYLGNYPKAIELLNNSLIINSTNDSAYYYLGVSQYHLGDYPDALVNLQMANAINDKRVGASKYLGICEFHYELYVDAIYSLQTALKIQKGDSEIYNYLGMCYYNVARIDLAIHTLKKGVAVGSKAASETAVNLALLYDDIQEQDSALYFLDKAIELDSTRVDAYYFAGNLHYNKGNYTESRGYFEKLLDINPKYRLAYKPLANVYFFEQLYDEAIAKYRMTTFFEEDNPEVLNFIGISYMKKQEYDKAEAYFEEAILIDPTYGMAYYNLAWIAFHNEVYNDAISYLTYALKTMKNDGDVFFLMAKVYVQLGILTDAEHYLAEAIRFNPLEENYYLYMGHLCMLKNEQQRAKFYYDILLTLDPGNSEAHYYNATIHYNQEKYNEALAHLEAAQSIEQENEKVLMNMSKSYLKIRNYSLALSTLQDLSKLTPEDPRVYYMISLAYKGKKDKILADYYETLAMNMDPQMAGFIY